MSDAYFSTALTALARWFNSRQTQVFKIDRSKEMRANWIIETSDGNYLLKYEYKPWYYAGKKLGFKGPGVTINYKLFDKYIKDKHYSFLYLSNNANQVKHFDYIDVIAAGQDHIQDYNHERVWVVPYDLLKPFVEVPAA